MCVHVSFRFLIICSLLLVEEALGNEIVSAKLSKVWGPGLKPHIISMPARYFFIQAVNVGNRRYYILNNICAICLSYFIIFFSISSDIGIIFDVFLEGVSKIQKPCRIWTNQLNRKDGLYIIRYKLYEPCFNFKIIIQYQNEHVDSSPYNIFDTIYPDECDCSTGNINDFLENWKCGPVPRQIIEDLKPFNMVDWDKTRIKVN
jgi:hypothetical protein